MRRERTPEPVEPLESVEPPRPRWSSDLASSVTSVGKTIVHYCTRLSFVFLLGIAVAALLAYWSQLRIESAAPLVKEQAPTVRSEATTGLYWFDDSQALAIGSRRVLPRTAAIDGQLIAAREPRELVRMLGNQTNRREDLRTAFQALSVLPDSTGNFYIRLRDQDLLTPGALSAVGNDGTLFVTGSAALRSPAGGPRGIVVNRPDPASVWQLVDTQGANRFVSLANGTQPITAMVFLPHTRLLAVGRLDGTVQLVQATNPAVLSFGASTAGNPNNGRDFRGHESPIVTMTAARSATLGERGADFASAASDGSIKIWRIDPDQFAQSTDVGFSEPTSAFVPAPDALELSPDGEALLVRGLAGEVYVASLARGSGPTQANPTIRLRRVTLPAPATAATLSSNGRRLFAAGTDCMIREIELEQSFGSFGLATAAPHTVATYSGHGAQLTHLTLSRDDGFLAAASLDGRVRIHNLSRARFLQTLPFADLPTGPPCPSTSRVVLGENEFYDLLIDVKFAGTLTREQMIAFGQSLRDMGWDAPTANRGGERTEKAIGLNVVRFGPPQNRQAAELLARQVSSLSPARVRLSVESVSSIPADRLELWISDATTPQTQKAPTAR